MAFQNAPTKQARDKAIAITELLEQILSHLPVKDILTCERINKHFNTTIKTSLVVRRASFRESPTDPLPTGGDYFVPPLTGHKFYTHRKEPIPINQYLLHRSYLGNDRIDIPLFLETDAQTLLNYGLNKTSILFSYEYLMGVKMTDRGSWREMYVCNAPLPLYMYQSEGGERPATGLAPRTMGKILRFESMTMGELVDAYIEKAVGEVERMTKRQWEESGLYPGLLGRLQGVLRGKYREVLGLEGKGK